ncbi:RagB/SusD family nutrient uptake outer membrane protein [Labilibacter sediminis]|nr:RagB/SusD family nutrient uptake outer membrane protein [Labilibacter sediminis]
MKKTIIKILTAFIAVLMVSCHGDLKEELKSSLSKENLTTPTDADNLVLGIYQSFIQGGWDYYAYGRIAQLNDGITDIMSWKGKNPIDDWEWGNDVAETIWTGAFEAINRANTALDIMTTQVVFDGISEDSLKLVGEAKFLRALAYYDLTLAFGDVPLLLKPTTGELYPERAPIEDVYTQIKSDLKDARNYLPVLTADNLTVGRATKGAALALSAKLAARLHEYEDALDYIEDLEALNVYDLYDGEYKDLWLESRNADNEFIFCITSYADNYEISNHHIKAFTPWSYDAGWTNVGYPWDNFLAIPDNDKRKELFHSHWTYYSNPNYGFQSLELYYTTYELYIDGVYHTPWWGNVPGVVCSKFSSYNRDVTAFGDPTAKYGTYASSSLNQPVLRYADILLLKAEVINEINNGPTSVAFDAINDVRLRANLTQLSGLGYDEFKQAVLDERALELCFEGHRKEDLIRNGVFEEVMGAMDKPTDEKYRLFPIPNQELVINPNMTPNETNN